MHNFASNLKHKMLVDKRVLFIRYKMHVIIKRNIQHLFRLFRLHL